MGNLKLNKLQVNDIISNENKFWREIYSKVMFTTKEWMDLMISITFLEGVFEHIPTGKFYKIEWGHHYKANGLFNELNGEIENNGEIELIEVEQVEELPIKKWVPKTCFKKNEIKINITGENNIGKSRVTYKLKEFLKNEGFNVELESNDFFSEMAFDDCMSNNIDSVIDNITEKSKIKITDNNDGFKGE